MGDRSSPQQVPLDIIHDILLRLPVKPLHRFLSVSKPLFSLISDPSFKKTYHHRRSNQNPHLLFTKKEDDANGVDTHVIFSTYNDQGSLLNKFSKTFPAHPHSTFEPFQSCLGLVCMGFFYNKPIMVCNPATEELVTVPKPPVQGYDQCIGFGYAKSTQEFKVVRLFQREAHHDYSSCEVFAVGGSDGWRKARNPPPYKPRRRAPLLNGALHLMPSEHYYVVREDRYFAVFDSVYKRYEHIPYTIAAIDIDTEEYRQVPLPDIYFTEAARSRCWDRVLYGELRGSLCLTFEFFRTDKLLELWFLKDYDNGIWVKEYTIDLFLQGSAVQATPITIMGDGSILVRVYLVNGNEIGLRRYNTGDNCFGENMGTDFFVMPYLESFMPLNKKEHSFPATQNEDDLHMEVSC